MNDLENKVLKYLIENARYTVEQLSAMTGASEKDVSNAIKNLEDSNTVLSYTVLTNDEVSQGYVDALIEVKVTPQKLKGFDALAEELCNFKEVRSLYLMSGGFDLALTVRGKDLREIASFVSEKLSAIDGVVSVATHFILKTYKNGGRVIREVNKENRQIYN